MGKMKAQKKIGGHKVSSAGPLADQIAKDQFPKVNDRVKKRHANNGQKVKEAVKMSGVLKQHQKLTKEDAMEVDELENAEFEKLVDFKKPVSMDQVFKDFQKRSKIDMADEERIFALLMPKKDQKFSSFQEEVKQLWLSNKEEIQSQIDTASMNGDELSEEIVNLYAKAGEHLKLLSGYREKLPRAITDIPNYKIFRKLLFHTNPESWSAVAVMRMTKVFSIQPKAVATVFYKSVLLSRCRDDIASYRRLNQHIYRALMTSTYNPVAFFYGLILPLCKSQDCTLREAVIFSSIITKKSFPTLIASAALVAIAQLDYTGANSIFMRAILDKRYTLAYLVLDSLVEHFVSFQNDSRKLPTLWHHAMLTLVQRYKGDLTATQKKQLIDLASSHSHKMITPEVHRELKNSKCRDPPKGVPK